MVYESCPMFAGGYGFFYFNWIIGALIFSGVFWGIYKLINNEKKKK